MNDTNVASKPAPLDVGELTPYLGSLLEGDLLDVQSHSLAGGLVSDCVLQLSVSYLDARSTRQFRKLVVKRLDATTATDS